MKPSYIFLFFTLIFLTACNYNKPAQFSTSSVVPTMPIISSDEVELEAVAIPSEVFGVKTDGFTLHGDKVQKGEFPAEILQSCNLSGKEVHNLVEAAKGKFDFRDMQVDRPYSVLCDEETNKATYFFYETDPENYVAFYIGEDSLGVELKEKEIEKRWAESSGVIENSLYETIVSNDLSPKLVSELADVYAWSVDFFRIKKGDSFRIIHKNKYDQGEFIGVSDIVAVNFNHHGQDYYAFWLEDDGEFGGYYDEKAESLQGAFLKAPLKFFRISSKYQKRRFHPVLKRNKPHLGTDYAAPTGTPIWSTANGTITKASYTRGNGNYVKVKHSETYSTQYLHMSKIAKGIKPGVRVKQGQVIGYVGSTGLATGPHVCYRFWKNGEQVDPYKEKLPSNKKLKEIYHETFFPYADSLRTLLDEMELMNKTKEPSIKEENTEQKDEEAA